MRQRIVVLIYKSILQTRQHAVAVICYNHTNAKKEQQNEVY
jgi:hypothetical protein